VRVKADWSIGSPENTVRFPTSLCIRQPIRFLRGFKPTNEMETVTVLVPSETVARCATRPVSDRHDYTPQRP
jgi:hypothetical protein|tara:strand:- start:1036 stop:1251 length:216 start_codon:yes stop_codon:yes gene_type:complete